MGRPFFKKARSLFFKSPQPLTKIVQGSEKHLGNYHGDAGDPFRTECWEKRACNSGNEQVGKAEPNEIAHRYNNDKPENTAAKGRFALERKTAIQYKTCHAAQSIHQSSGTPIARRRTPPVGERPEQKLAADHGKDGISQADTQEDQQAFVPEKAKDLFNKIHYNTQLIRCRLCPPHGLF